MTDAPDDPPGPGPAPGLTPPPAPAAPPDVRPSPLSRAIARLRAKGLRYWITAVIVLMLASTGSGHVYDYLRLSNVRAHVFQKLLDWAPRPTEPRYVRLVLIRNDDYWQGALAGRRPLKRDYLAHLVDRLVDLKVHVIALDVDERLPDPGSLAVPGDYRAESDELIASLRRAAIRGAKVVLATPISFDAQHRYHRDSDLYQANGLCIQHGAANGNPPPQIDPVIARNVTCGYIALPFDPLMIPGPVPMDDDSYLDPFGLAIARASNPTQVERTLKEMGGAVRYVNFISHDKFDGANVELPASRVFSTGASEELDILSSSVVLVGAYWSRDADGRGPLVDQHWTPVGMMVGVELHANYAEAFLDSRVFRSTPEWVLHGSELLLSITAAIILALIPGFWATLVALVGMVVGLTLVTWIALHEFGVFFDSLVPLVGLGLHALYERLLGHSESEVHTEPAH